MVGHPALYDLPCVCFPRTLSWSKIHASELLNPLIGRDLIDQLQLSPHCRKEQTRISCSFMGLEPANAETRKFFEGANA